MSLLPHQKLGLPPDEVLNRIGSTTKHSTKDELEKLRDAIGELDVVTEIELVCDTDGKPAVCQLHYSYDGWLGPDDQLASVNESTVCPYGVLSAIRTPTSTRLALSVADIRCNPCSNLGLVWLLEEQHYAVVYYGLYAEDDDDERDSGDRVFWPKERKGRLPGSKTVASIALLDCNPFGQIATVTQVEDDGLIIGMVNETGEGMRPDFGLVELTDVQICRMHR